MAANKSANETSDKTAKNSGASDSDAPAAPQATKRSGVLAPLALLAAVLALVLAGWVASQQLALNGSSGGADAGQLAAIEQRLVRFADNLAAQQRSIADVEEALANSLSSVADLPPRLGQLEQQVAKIPGINSQSRAEWLKAEAVYYLRLANAQASLAGNAKVAASALRLADDKLRDSGDPTVGPVRAKLSDEVAALEALPEVDRAGITFRLQALAAQVDDWSFPAIAPDSFAPGIAPPKDELGPWDRLVATLRSVFASIVSIKETEAPQAAQLGAAEQALIRESVKAELQVARLAFVSGNVELYTQSLDRVEQQIGAYFDPDTSAVAAALKAIGALRTVEMPGELPDISGSLALLLERMDSSRSTVSGGNRGAASTASNSSKSSTGVANSSAAASVTDGAGKSVAEPVEKPSDEGADAAVDSAADERSDDPATERSDENKRVISDDSATEDGGEEQ
jgi:uroporphyrin-3 C-methyltransferase